MSRPKTSPWHSLTILLLVALLSLPAARALAQDQASGSGLTIVVLPFEINADPEMAYLKESLPQLLGDRLQELGFETVPVDKMAGLIAEHQIEYLDLDTAKDMALLSGAGYAVYGSFNQLGDMISLDVRLVEAFGLKPAKPLFVVEEGLINALPAIENLADKIRLELLKKEQIVAIEIAGTKVLEADVVRMNLRMQKGDVYDPKKINDEVKRIYDLGYFDDVRIRTDDLPDGIKVTVEVQEKPRIQTVNINGNDELDDEDLLEVMNTKSGTVLNPKVISEDLAKIRELYRKEGYYNVDVAYALDTGETGSAALNVNIDEGQKLYIKEVRLEGVEQLDEDDVRDELLLSERGMFSWFTGTGVLQEELLVRDTAALEAYYGNRGFLDVAVAQPEVSFEEDGIVITFRVQEGVRYRVGDVRFSGDILVDQTQLYDLVRMDELAAEEEYFDRSALREDSQALTEFYSDYGYAFAEADYLLASNATTQTVDVDYRMAKRNKIYVRRVLIEGNTRTRDNVIRRELRLADGDLFSGSKLRRSNIRLSKTGFFEQVDLAPAPTENEDEVDLRVKVQEKATGQLAAGMGYSTYSRFFVSGSVQQRNLFGKGYHIGLYGAFSGKSVRYNFVFTNPNFNDSDLLVGTDVYYYLDEYDDYDKDTLGGRVRLAHPVGEYSTIGGSYRLDRSVITEVDSDASSDIKDVEGTRYASAVTGHITRDTTNRRMNPTEGNRSSISTEYAGGVLMGDDQFIKSIIDSSQYWPIWFSHVFHLHGQAGYIMEQFGDDEIPVYERFYLGGIRDVRGYDNNYISPVDPESGDRIGGNKQYFGNVEYIFPIVEDMGLMGLGFFDFGEVADIGDSFDFDPKKGTGVGIRWYSPMGPMRLEYGFALDDSYDETAAEGIEDGKLEFSVGQFF